MSDTVANVHASPERLLTAPLVGIFYFRAHNRSPGGNYDMATIKVTLWAREGRPPELRVASYRNWDGSHYRSEESAVRMDPSALVPELRRLAAELVAAGAVDQRFTIWERRIDTDEYDTEWTDVDLTLSLAPPEGRRAEDGAPVLGLRQSTVPSDGYSARTPAHDPPDQVSQAFVDVVMRMCGVGRVKQMSEGEDDLSRLTARGASRDLGYVDSDMPMVL